MTIYQNHYSIKGESNGYSYHTSKKDAELAKKSQSEEVEITTDVRKYPLTKAGMIRALTYFGAHPNNG